MKTKAQIIQELLEKQLITVDDAMILMMADDTPKIYFYPLPPDPQPYYPSYPQYPYYGNGSPIL